MLITYCYIIKLKKKNGYFVLNIRYMFANNDIIVGIIINIYLL